MKNILVFGNSGSGKSTLARELCTANGLAHLDLDTLAWKPTSPPERKPLAESEEAILCFIHAQDDWVIEGCYADLLAIALPFSSEIIFLNLSIDQCIENAKNRPWEPHKYQSSEDQDKNLDMLVRWISQYDDRNDTFSRLAHTQLYETYPGKKRMFTNNRRNI